MFSRRDEKALMFSSVRGRCTSLAVRWWCVGIGVKAASADALGGRGPKRRVIGPAHSAPSGVNEQLNSMLMPFCPPALLPSCPSALLPFCSSARGASCNLLARALCLPPPVLGAPPPTHRLLTSTRSPGSPPQIPIRPLISPYTAAPHHARLCCYLC